MIKRHAWKTKMGPFYSRQARVKQHTIDFVLKRECVFREARAVISLNETPFGSDDGPLRGRPEGGKLLFMKETLAGMIAASALAGIQSNVRRQIAKRKESSNTAS